MLSRVAARRLPAGDDGLTLVEMVVALFLATLILTSFVGVAIAGAGASRVADARSRANQVGNAELESLKALPWSSLGLYDTDGASCGSEPIVSLGATAPTPRVAPSYQRTSSVNGRSYTITDCVTWTDDPSDGTSSAGTETDSDSGHDIKHLVVKVQWTLMSKTRSVSFDALRTPTTVEVPPTVHSTGAVLGLTANAASPTSQQLAGNYALSSPLTLSVTANLAATSVTVTYSGRTGSVTKNLTTSDGGLNWSITIPADATTGGTFNPGTTTFSFAGSSPSGSAQASTTASFTAPPTPFTLTANATPSSVTLDSSGYLTSAITLKVTTSVVATSVTVSYPTKSGTGSGTLTSSDGLNWTLVLPANTTTGPYAATSSEVFTFTGTASTGSTTGTATTTLTAPAASTVVVKSIVVRGYASGNICADSNSNNAGKSRAAQTVSITITNLAASDSVKLSWTAPTGGPVTAGTGVASGSDYIFTATIPASTPFDNSAGASTTSTTLTVTTKRASDGVINQATQPVTVQWQKNSGTCT